MSGRSFTPRDIHALMTLLVKEATGQDSTITEVDSSTFVSAGEQVLSTGMENTLNALSMVLGRTFMAVRPYSGKLKIINAIDTGAYTDRMRKISFYSRNPQASGDWNTQSYTNLAMDFDNGTNPSSGTPQSTSSMWQQNQPVPLELNFGGRSVWEDSTTIYEYQVKQAFRSEAEFAQFVAGIMTEKGNDIESQKEAFNRMTLLNYIGGLYSLSGSMRGSVINLTRAYNERFGTNYTSAQLRSVYLKSFLEFFVATFRTVSDWMTNRSMNRHWSPSKTINSVDYVLLRHTPKDRQRLIMYSPLFTESEAMVMPEIFNPRYLDMANYEGVQFWQNENDPSAVDVVPAIPNIGSPESGQTYGAEVELPYVVGVLYDADAMMVDYQLEASAVTPLEARKHYRNMWWTFAKNSINDFTENGVLFIMQDVGGVTVSVTNTLTHVTNSNTGATEYLGGTYEGTLTADDTYTMSSVAVTMGGTDITATAYNNSNGKIKITNVTGNIVITATAEA